MAQVVDIARDRFEAVVLDLDGVITRTAKVHARAWKQVFDEYLEHRTANGEPPFAPFEIERDYPPYVDGKPRYDGVRSFLASRGIVLPDGTPSDPPGYDTVCAVGNRKDEIFLGLLDRGGVEVFDDAVDRIRRWRERGLKTAVVSSSKNCEQVLRATHLRDLFDVQVDGVLAERLGLPGKPAPDTFLEATRRLGVDPRKSVVVEDAYAGVQAGRDGHFALVVGVAREAGRAEALRKAGADVVVQDLTELPEMPAASAAEATPTRPAPTPPPLDALPATPTADPAWLLVEEGFDPVREHEIESLFTIANGYSGTRGSLAEGSPFSMPAALAAGVFGMCAEPGAIPELVKLPDWTHMAIEVNGHRLSMEDAGTLDHRRTLDLLQGILWRWWRYRTPDGRISAVRMLRLASLADRHVLLQSLALTAENYSGPVRFEGRLSAVASEPRLTTALWPAGSTARPGTAPDAVVAEFVAPCTDLRVAMAAAGRFSGAADLRQSVGVAEDSGFSQREFEAEVGKTYRLDRLVCVYTSRDTPQPAEAALNHLHRLMEEADTCRLVEAHRRAWAQRWRGADVEVEGDPEAQRALRFAGYHLIAVGNPEDEHVSIGARALTGEAYRGHVFWDTEIFMLPFYIFTDPPTARALLAYRYHTLPGAREKARQAGYRGAMYAWESAADGRETTPSWGVTPEGVVVPILSGQQEHHITADVAYAVWQYWKATGDDEFFLQMGAEILLETARYWASRGSPGPDGLVHITRVIGPDEYHEGIDDNAFTNVMAQWDLLRGAETVRLLAERWPARGRALLERLEVTPEEAQQWRSLAGAMYAGFDPRTGLFEQFRGYFDLEPIDLASYEPRTAPIDILLGRERTQRSQVVKQADVVMLVALLRDQWTPDVPKANFDFYAPRTSHGSSLSPASHALVAARLGDVETAQRYFRQAARIDLANNMGNAAGGVHAAALGGLWQAAVLGFGGMSLREDGLSFAPHLPADWRRLRFPVRWRGRAVVVTVDADPLALEVQLTGPDGMVLAVEGGPQIEAVPDTTYRIGRNDAGWGPWSEMRQRSDGPLAAGETR